MGWLVGGVVLLLLWLALMFVPVTSETITFTKGPGGNTTHRVRKIWRFGRIEQSGEETLTDLHKKEFSDK